MKDPLYYHRPEYAAKLVNSLKDGITHAFTLFAPRRMGKTQFLLQDASPEAQRQGFNVFYFSFMDTADPAADFQTALCGFARSIRAGGKAADFIGSISKLEALGFGIEREAAAETPPRLSELIGLAAADNRPSLLLLDEIQELARAKDTGNLIKSFRTGLDIHKDRIKTIFTGSSTNGLRAMFNDNKAPFFHFAHALDFPLLGREFTDFLADIYAQRTGGSIDRAALYALFGRLHHTPMYLRAIIQDMILNPTLSLEEAAAQRMADIGGGQAQAGQWEKMKPLERAIIRDIAAGGASIYGAASRRRYAALLGLDNIAASSVQSAVKRMERREWISRDAQGRLIVGSPLLQTWIVENIEVV
ncbi:Predicted ATPase (AAA+ superfamily) [Kingella potus]|uniref:Predicted ATPase (AAA+ superfamily) n=1 Tax=Kingella potus TaxID=265175 RepID=A0A377R2D8_9NEIS|nr:ATP-binding protein [Kingella potus]UOO99844.1 ATP-binding protein [Kingella potus]STR03098.1 Predicted ATPase (AAA+ superfamily) [Kingella potus]